LGTTRRLSGFVRLIRPINCSMMGLAVTVGAALAGKDTLTSQPQNLTLGFFTGFFLTAATMAINDHHDRDIDAINEPKRPIPSGAVAPREALIFALILTAVGFGAAVFTNWECSVLAAFSWAVFVFYTTHGKRMGFVGNLLVSTCIAMPFVYGGFVVGEGVLLTTGIFVAMVFLSNTGREVTKGIVDVQGDREKRIQTVAVQQGEKRAALVAAALYLSAVAITPLPWLLAVVTPWYLPFAFFADMGLILASILLVLDPSRDNARRIKNRNLVWFFSGLMAFLVGA
jgi:geranylgeranylglycerol-phosphate geranylgeranyltransferase